MDAVDAVECSAVGVDEDHRASRAPAQPPVCSGWEGQYIRYKQCSLLGIGRSCMTVECTEAQLAFAAAGEAVSRAASNYGHLVMVQALCSLVCIELTRRRN